MLFYFGDSHRPSVEQQGCCRLGRGGGVGEESPLDVKEDNGVDRQGRGK